MTDWKLVEVGETECTLDDSGLYVVIHRIETPDAHKGRAGVRVTVRADLMDAATRTEHTPVRSFIGRANDVRKALIDYIWNECPVHIDEISMEHASYIGYELRRAETTPGFVQD